MRQILIKISSLANRTCDSNIASNYIKNRLHHIRPLNSSIFRFMSSIKTMDQLNRASEQAKKVYVQRNNYTDKMIITFEYDINGKSRQYHLNREPDEPLSSSLERIKLNIDKFVKKKSKKQSEKDKIVEHNEVSLKIEDLVVDPDKTKNIDAWVDGAIMELNGVTYEIRTNEPQVEFMKLPVCIMKDFSTIPYVQLTNCSLDDCEFTWYRQVFSRDFDDVSKVQGVEKEGLSYWLKLKTGFAYSPTMDDVARCLRVMCRPILGDKVGPIYNCYGKNPVEIGPVDCPFENRHKLTSERLTKKDEFRIVSYNVLADVYADQDYSRSVLFAHCPPHLLNIDYRRPLILKELTGYNADIICLQEVDKKEFFKAYDPFMKFVEGFSSAFNRKGGQVAEGVATFFRKDKFDMIETHSTLLMNLVVPGEEVVEDDTTVTKSGDCEEKAPVGFSDMTHPILGDLNSKIAQDCLAHFNDLRNLISSNESLLERFKRHTVLQTVLLKTKNHANHYVLVANTHLYFAPDADHIRLLQGSICVKYLEFIKKYYHQLLRSEHNELDPSISIMFCGDMNSTPDCGLYKLVIDGLAPHNLPDWSSNKEESVDGIDITTNLKFDSAYKDVPYTNFTPLFHGCLDYIYYSSDSLSCERNIPLPDHEDVIASDGIPSDVFPSDHLALVADFRHLR